MNQYNIKIKLNNTEKKELLNYDRDEIYNNLIQTFAIHFTRLTRTELDNINEHIKYENTNK